MEYPKNFIMADAGHCTLEKHVPAPCFRKSFILDKAPVSASVVICGLGFYELTINGRNITKGALAPYISNPDDLVYYDSYDIADMLVPGENVIAVLLGNGFQNSSAGSSWLFDTAPWRGAPRLALRLDMGFADGSELSVISDNTFKTAGSAITFNDLRCGEFYDARREQPGWNDIGFDDSGWDCAVPARAPRGRPSLCEAEPIVVTRAIAPVSVTRCGEGFIYDFGENCAGVCKLTVEGTAGQEISLEHGECVTKDGQFYQDTVNILSWIEFMPRGYVQHDSYICKGGGEESFVPRFTYHGFRYVLVKGITEEQAKKSLLTYLVMNSGLEERGSFTCSDDTTNRIQEAVRRSTLANFYYFPTDCPHREKNGWTGDASVSAEHTLLNLNAEQSYREWFKNIRRAQSDEGVVPGIIPNAGWGYEWGHGPAWDSAITNICYYIYRYRGDRAMLAENATMILRYLDFLSKRLNENGLVCYGLGDWCPPAGPSNGHKSPLEFTDSVMAMDICKKAAFIFEVLGLSMQRDFAESFGKKLRETIREKLIDFETMTAEGRCQTSQAMALYYGVFEENERPLAFTRLLEFIEAEGNRMDTGILGARTMFHVLSEFGRTDLAYEMITTPEFPSYGNLIARGANTLWESFQPEGQERESQNHHFFGDVSGWFIKDLLGIALNPSEHNVNEVLIRPGIIPALTHAEGFHIAPAGKIEVRWEWNAKNAAIRIVLPDSMTGRIELPLGMTFADGQSTRALSAGETVLDILSFREDSAIA